MVTDQEAEALRPRNPSEGASGEEPSPQASVAPGAATTEQFAGEAPPAEETPSRDALLGLLTEARGKADANWEQYLRVRAELDNLRKRHERDLENAHKYALDGFVRDLLPVRDSLEKGDSAAQEEGANIERLREGTTLTLRLLGDVMSKFGVEPVDPQGQPFNPELHQAMSMQPRNDMPPNTVVVVVQKGYRLHGRLVRPALVIVSAAGG